MLKNIFSESTYQKIVTTAAIKDIAEVRLKLNQSIQIYTIYGSLLHSGAIATGADIQRIVDYATGFSRYAYEEEIHMGYLVLAGGYRVGLGGTFIEKDGKIELKECNSLVIRIPHEVYHAANTLIPMLNGCVNMLILSPPGGGKTTMLRDIARELSERRKTLIIDERFEIAGLSGELNVGRSDVVAGVKKKRVLEGVIRAMSPEIVLLDELFGQEDYALIEDLAAAGIAVIATLHAKDVAGACVRFPNFKNVFCYAVTLTSKPRAGSIQSIERL